MIIDKIILHNFGVYLGRQSLSLRPKNEKKPIILIGGLNGVGKTTLLDAFQLALFGKLANCSGKGSMAYDKFLLNSIHKSVDPNEGAAVIIKFRHSVNGIEYTYQVNRSWRMNGKNIKETLEVLCNNEFDPVVTEAWYEHVEQFMPLRISSLFFFDGEKIKDFADFKNSTALISTGINQLLGLDLIDQLSTDLVALEKRKKIKLSDKTSRKEIFLIESEIVDLTKKKDDHEWEIRASEKTLKLLEDQLKDIDEKFRVEGGELYQVREDLEARKNMALSELREINEKLIDLAGSELPLILQSNRLRKILKQSKIEEQATDNKKLYNTLKKRDGSIKRELKSSGIPQKVITEVSKILNKDLKRRAKFKQIEKYLNLDLKTKDLITSVLADLNKSKISTLKDIIEHKKDIQEEIENIERQLAKVPDAEAIAQIIEKKEKIELSKNEADINHGVLLKELQDIERAIAIAERQMEKKLDKKFSAEYEHDSAYRIIKHSEKSRATLELFKERVVRHHLDKIQKRVLEAFKKLLRKEALVSRLELDTKSFQPEIIGSDNKPIDVLRLSAGERQLLAVSLLWGLAQASERPLPTIIDTPLGRLDATHRTHLVKRYFPFASHQVLLLSTDEEINDKYYRMIKPWLSKTYHLKFNESNQSTEIKNGYFW